MIAGRLIGVRLYAVNTRKPYLLIIAKPFRIKIQHLSPQLSSTLPSLLPLPPPLSPTLPPPPPLPSIQHIHPAPNFTMYCAWYFDLCNNTINTPGATFVNIWRSWHRTTCNIIIYLNFRYNIFLNEIFQYFPISIPGCLSPFSPLKWGRKKESLWPS